MNLFSFFKRNRKQKPPDHNHRSIFRHIESNLDREGRLTEAGYVLPDEPDRNRNRTMRWAPGAQDGVFGYHFQRGDVQPEAEKVAALVESISRQNDGFLKEELYLFLLKDKPMDFIDAALEKALVSRESATAYLVDYARWLAFESPDRGPVKFGIALLGRIGDEQDLEKVILLGRHEEFTLFSAVAVANFLENPEQILWYMAQYVDGWGRIHLVERLKNTQDPEIKRWLLREGFRNDIVYQYLACTCATAGDLKRELSNPDVDAELLFAAGEIIEALIDIGPAEQMLDYKDGAEATRLYVSHVKDQANSLDEFLMLYNIKRFVGSRQLDGEKIKELGWTEALRAEILTDIHEVLADPKWEQEVFEKQLSANDYWFWQADQVAAILGIDLWETYWQRLTADPHDTDLWSKVMIKVNEDGIDPLISLALETIPLDQIAAGPANEMGLGKEFHLHRCLDYLLEPLATYHGKAPELVTAALQSPVVSNRQKALYVLSVWPRKFWPQGTLPLLEQAEAIEPDEDIKADFLKVLAGKRVECKAD